MDTLTVIRPAYRWTFRSQQNREAGQSRLGHYATRYAYILLAQKCSNINRSDSEERLLMKTYEGTQTRLFRSLIAYIVVYTVFEATASRRLSSTTPIDRPLPLTPLPVRLPLCTNARTTRTPLCINSY
uniref:Bestrophin homolog n=1 Tax=Steinernema glaseri TaxID=37863 RepID=A0A1I7YRH3_9BILA